MAAMIEAAVPAVIDDLVTATINLQRRELGVILLVQDAKISRLIQAMNLSELDTNTLFEYIDLFYKLKITINFTFHI